MLSKTGTYKFHIESYTCDFTGKVTLPIIGNFILQAATIHASERNFGYDEMSEGNAAWVLSRLSIQMYEYPGHDRDLIVETWVQDVARFYTQRCFRFLNGENQIIGYARSIWAAIDIQTRRPIDIPSWRPDLNDYVEEEKECPIDKMSKIPSVDDTEPAMGYSVRYSDIDINNHMNSVKYMEHAINVFEPKMFEDKVIHKFEIVYLAEGQFGDKLKLYCSDLSDTEVLIDTKRCDESICRCRIIWK